MEKTLQESVALAMDCDELAILPHLPYLLQDFYELGSSPPDIAMIARENAPARPAGPAGLRALELGCGKGAVIAEVCASFGCEGLGVDAVPEFIEFARAKARERGLTNCRFMLGDARKEINSLRGYDLIILASVGPVFGDYLQTAQALTPALAPDGVIIIDDGYIDDDSPSAHPLALKRSELERQVRAAGMTIACEYRWDADEAAEGYLRELAWIEARCRELAERHPRDASLFEAYLDKQRREYQALSNDIVCAAFALKRR